MRIHDLSEQTELPADAILIQMGVVKEEREVILEFLPLIPLALWGAGAAWTAYDTYQAKKALDRGEITQAQFATKVGTDVAIGIAGGAVAKGVFKLGKFAWQGGKKVFAKGAGAAGEATTDAGKALAKKTETPKVDITAKVADEAPIKNPIVPKIAQVAKPGDTITTAKGKFLAGVDGKATTTRLNAPNAAAIKDKILSIAAANVDSAATAAAKNVDNVAVQARKAADNTATAAKNSSATVQGTQAANDASAAARKIAQQKADVAIAKNAMAVATAKRLADKAAADKAAKLAADIATKKAAQVATKKAAQVAANKAAAKLAAKRAAQTTASDANLIGLAGKVSAKKAADIASKKTAALAARKAKYAAAKLAAKNVDNTAVKFRTKADRLATRNKGLSTTTAAAPLVTKAVTKKTVKKLTNKQRNALSDMPAAAPIAVKAITKKTTKKLTRKQRDALSGMPKAPIAKVVAKNVDDVAANVAAVAARKAAVKARALRLKKFKKTKKQNAKTKRFNKLRGKYASGFSGQGYDTNLLGVINKLDSFKG